ncbi:MAG TPA: TlpA disulfide reductase family protein [Acidimicrobiales bacterium]|jgi:thiol-disulfide isomerase/thioredoxin|nr:TlpA disulfide reductase family protein [Acidimicrobiales bacterium]
MSNRPNPRTRRPAPARPGTGDAPAPRSSRVPLLIGLGVVLVIAVVIAIVASAGDDTNGKDAAGLSQTQPATITGTALVQLPGSGTDPAVGKAAPQVDGLAFDGTPVTIKNDGKPKLVAFVAHWCPHCQREVPVITKWLADNGMPSDVALYAVATATSSDNPNYPPSAWLAREKWPITTMADTSDDSVAAAFGLSAYPYFVAIDAKGNVAARTTGELTTTQLQQLLSIAAGKT